MVKAFCGRYLCGWLFFVLVLWYAFRELIFCQHHDLRSSVSSGDCEPQLLEQRSAIYYPTALFPISITCTVYLSQIDPDFLTSICAFTTSQSV
jgi:hypothetical protein